MSTSKFDIAYMKTARAVAELSHDKTKVGCVLVKDRHIISTGYNGTPKGTDNQTRSTNGATLDTVIHAEMNAVLYAKESLKDATCYTTFYPCKRCAIYLYQAGIKEIVYSDSNNNAEQDAAARWIAETSNFKIRRVSDESNSEDNKVSK